MKRQALRFSFASAALILTTLGAVSAVQAEPAASGECRRFVPTVGVTVTVPCIETVSTTSTAAAIAATPVKAVATAKADAATKVVAASVPAAVAEPAAIVPSSAKPSIQPSTQPGGRLSGNTMKRCVEILDRAQFGKSLPGDAAVLRDSCRTAG